MLRSGAPILSVEALSVRSLCVPHVDRALIVGFRPSDGKSTLMSNTVSRVGDPLDLIKRCTNSSVSPDLVSTIAVPPREFS